MERRAKLRHKRRVGSINSFDLLRLAAAVAVIFHHSRVLQGLSPITLGRLDFGSLGVGVFFVISGYLVTASYGRSAGLGDYLRKRLLRIEPALIACLLLTALVFGAAATTLPLGEYFCSDQVWLYVLRNALLYPVTYDLPGVFAHNPYPAVVNGSLWSLRLEFTCYLGVAALAAAGQLRRGVVAGLAIAALAVFATLGWLRSDLAQGEVLRLTVLAAQFGFLFLAGAYLQLLGRPAPRWTLLSAVFLATPLWVLGLPAMIIAVGELRGPRLPADVSYGLYIYAFPIQQMLAAAGMSSFALATALTLPFAAASWFLVERPALRLKPRGPAGVVVATPSQDLAQDLAPLSPP
jgi:peptidoglycan/LPS O-acetylase OafA/YrhL